MMNPEISIIVPVYNAQSYLKRCLDSLIQQTYWPLEIILVDDGSSDQSAEICDQYSGTYPNIKTFHQANRGVSAARNKGLEEAHGKYIGFCDADDWVEPAIYSSMYEGMKRTGAQIAFCGYDEIEISDNTHQTHSPDCPEIVTGNQALELCLLPPRIGFFTSLWNKLFEAELFDDYRFPEAISIGEDEDFLVKTLPSVPKVFIDHQIGYHWIVQDNSESHPSAINKRSLSGIDGKEELIAYMERKDYGVRLLSLMKSRLYSDYLHLLIVARQCNDAENFKEIRRRIKTGRPAFLKNTHHSKKYKLKICACEAMLLFKVNPDYVKKVYLYSSSK